MLFVQRDWNLMCESGSQQEVWDGAQGAAGGGCALGWDALGRDVGVPQWEGAGEEGPDVPVDHRVPHLQIKVCRKEVWDGGGC